MSADQSFQSPRDGARGIPKFDASIPINGRELARISDTITLEVKCFANDPHSSDIDEIAAFVQNRMQEMNRAFPGLPPDTPQQTRELLTAPGAHTIIERGVVPHSLNTEPQITGYGLIFKGVEHWPDRDHVPAYLRQNPNACRGNRLFVSKEGREMQAYGEAVTRILDEFVRIADGNPIIGMVLTDIVALRGELSSDLSRGEWKDALRALKARGYEDTGDSIVKRIKHGDDKEIAVNFRWHVFPPFSNAGQESMAQHNARFETLHQKRRERLAAAVAVLPSANELILVYDSLSAPYDIAKCCPADMVIGIDPSRRHLSRGLRANLLLQPYTTDGLDVGANSAGAILVLGVLPDIARQNPDDPRGAIRRFFKAHYAQLKEGGMILVRDTIGPDEPSNVKVYLSHDFAERFARFRSGEHEPHIPQHEWQKVIRLAAHPETGWPRFLMPEIIRWEFLLKYLYENDWAHERPRSFTLLTAAERIEEMREMGVRLIYAGPEKSRFLADEWHSNMRAADFAGRAIADPTTNYTTIAEKVGPDEGITIRHAGSVVTRDPGFVAIRSYLELDPQTGENLGAIDIASRKNKTHDVVAYKIRNKQVGVVCRIFPRPLMTIHDHLLDGSLLGGRFAEQVAAIVAPEELVNDESTDRSAREILVNRAGIAAENIIECDRAQSYFTLPSMLDEEVFAQPVRITGDFADRKIHIPESKFAPTVTVRMCDGKNVLEGCQVGGYQDPRVERVIYDLTRQHQLDRGPWLGERISLKTQNVAQAPIHLVDEIFDPTPTGIFVAADPFGFFDVRSESFEDLDRNSIVRGEITLESVVPRNLSWNAVPVLPMMQLSVHGGVPELWIGVRMINFPSESAPSNVIRFATVPTFHLGKEIKTVPQAQRYVGDRMADFGFKVRGTWTSGAKFAASPGITPLFCYPMGMEVGVEALRNPGLLWGPLRMFSMNRAQIRCGLLRTLLNRTEHALGV